MKKKINNYYNHFFLALISMCFLVLSVNKYFLIIQMKQRVITLQMVKDWMVALQFFLILLIRKFLNGLMQNF
ncbi:hypothetical protein AA0X95_14180 [Bacillus sp. 1P10SD]|uniref:hypothetical protein n=1 Tax=Bacillus sp. 1P10SD TaxID=3132265 RepID=UPI0039A62A14